MAKKKSKSFGKHIYALVAIIVLLVAAGIASYATAPAGAASHGTLYADNIYGKTSNLITIRDASMGSTLLRVDNTDVNGLGIYASGGDTAVIGINGAGNSGKLATPAAGVEGTVDSATGFGVYGKQAAGGYAVKGLNTASGNYGEIGGVTTGVKGYGSSYGVQGSTGLSGLVGVEGFTSNPAGYAGKFTGGKGLYASKIEFGASAFSATGNSGSLIIGAAGVVACSTVCTAHGLGCLAAYTLTGTNPAYNCGVPPVGAPRYCWCGSA